MKSCKCISLAALSLLIKTDIAAVTLEYLSHFIKLQHIAVRFPAITVHLDELLKFQDLHFIFTRFIHLIRDKPLDCIKHQINFLSVFRNIHIPLGALPYRFIAIIHQLNNIFKIFLNYLSAES